MTRPVAVAAATLLALATPAHARPVSRTVTQPYDHPALGTPDLYGFCWTVYRGDAPPENHGCVRFQVGARERTVAFDVADASGLPVAAVAEQDSDRDGVLDTEIRFCGSIEGQRVVDGEIIVWLPMSNVEAPVCLGHATSGTVRATFRTAR